MAQKSEILYRQNEPLQVPASDLDNQSSVSFQAQILWAL